MKVQQSNLNQLPIRDQKRVEALMRDIEAINLYPSKPSIFIDWQDYHNEYSPERTDPCPDYYGYYRLKTNNGDLIGLEMNVDTLDDCLCVLYDYLAL